MSWVPPADLVERFNAGENRSALAKRYGVSDTTVTAALRRLGVHVEIRERAKRGNGYVSPNGYRYVSVGGKRKMEHRHVMEQHLGRGLLPGETVHHRGAKDDNRIEMLELRVDGHRGLSIDEALAWAREIIARYGKET